MIKGTDEELVVWGAQKWFLDPIGGLRNKEMSVVIVGPKVPYKICCLFRQSHSWFCLILPSNWCGVKSAVLSLQRVLSMHACMHTVASVESDSLWPPWTAAFQALLSMGFSRQEYWSGLPFPSLGELPETGIQPTAPAWQADALSPNY